jgi:hypothetical protein
VNKKQKRVLFISLVLISLAILGRYMNADAENKTYIEQSIGALFSHVIIPPAPTIWDGYEELERICACESGLGTFIPHQFEDDGTPLWSRLGTNDVGACQIHMPLHASASITMGLDVVSSFEDNVAYAKFLYDHQGNKPWRASEMCWGSL